MSPSLPSPPLADRQDPNEAIKAFLKNYVQFRHAPHYAVLLDGAWGSGKSHLVKAFLNETFADRSNQYIYISLYGVASTSELDEALFAAAYPLLETRGARIATGVGKAVLKHLKYELPALKADDVLKRLKASVYVFDDLERAKLDVDQVMGYINQLVEHEGKKVIVLANQDKLDGDRQAYNVRREKVVGRVFSVRPNLNAAVHSFVQRIDDRIARPFLHDRLQRVCDIFEQADLGNLRILQQAMWDFERLCGCLNDKHQAKPEAMDAMLSLLLPLAIDYKAGRLTDEDITGRQRYPMRLTEEAKSHLETTRKRYTGTDIYDAILTNDILGDLLANGRITADSLAESLERSRFFAPPATEPAWQTVWNWQIRDAALVQQAIDTLEAQLAAKEFVISGELLHVFGIRLLLAKGGLIPLSREGVVDAATVYIDDLLDHDRLEPPDHDAFAQTGYAGLGFIEANSAEFRAIFQHLNQARSEQTARSLPQRARELLDLMATDIYRFRNALLATGGNSGEYYQIPILARIPAADFAATFDRLAAESQRHVMEILRGRYEFEALTGRLAGERAWLAALGEALTTLANARAEFAAFRLNTFVSWFIHEPLAAASKADAVLQARGDIEGPKFPASTDGDQP